MSETSRFEPPPDFVDPRTKPGFAAEHWPLCNGEPTPAWVSADLHHQRCIEFLASFYELNVLHGRLHAARLAKKGERTTKPLLTRIGDVTKALEAIEDRYAPIGFFAEPIMAGIKYQNVIFVRPEPPRLLPKPQTASSHFAIPGLEEIPESEFKGPVQVFRFGHGKVDF